MPDVYLSYVKHKAYNILKTQKEIKQKPVNNMLYVYVFNNVTYVSRANRVHREVVPDLKNIRNK